MTVTYIHHVPSADQPGAFFRLLVIWRGGVFKGIWKDCVLYFFFYTLLSISYRYLMIYDEEVKANFEKVCVYMKKFEDLIPLGFLLGFYVTQVMNRWWNQFLSLPWVDGIGSALNTFMPGSKWVNVRRKIIRYSMLSMILVFKKISAKMGKKYKNYQSLVNCGLLTQSEKVKLEELEKSTHGQYHLYWVPLRWAKTAVRSVYEAGDITDVMLDRILTEITRFGDCCGTLLCYAWVNIPLVYTQIVTLSVHIYFGVALLGRQHLTPTRYVGAAGDYVKVAQGTAGSVNLVGYDDSILDFYVPIFTILQYIFYFGWLQVAKTLINPFGGEDDEDFDVEYLINRNFQVGYLLIKDSEDEDKEALINNVEVLGIGDIPYKIPSNVVNGEDDQSTENSLKKRFTKKALEENMKITTMDELKTKLHLK